MGFADLNALLWDHTLTLCTEFHHDRFLQLPDFFLQPTLELRTPCTLITLGFMATRAFAEIHEIYRPIRQLHLEVNIQAYVLDGGGIEPDAHNHIPFIPLEPDQVALVGFDRLQARLVRQANLFRSLQRGPGEHQVDENLIVLTDSATQVVVQGSIPRVTHVLGCFLDANEPYNFRFESYIHHIDLLDGVFIYTYLVTFL